MTDGGSDTVRFSVEVLLYYSPRFDEAGTALSDAGVAAQRRLEGLGSFWGSSWPDESFASSYRPAHHSLLVMAQQCAADLQQIAARIELMAREYGVTEANVAADIDRISEGASREARLLRGTGGLPPPPDVPESSTPGPPRTTPAPAPNPSPTPPSSTPARPRPPKSTPPAPPSTPRPSPQAPPNPWRRAGPNYFFGPFPTGKPELMEEAAGAWRDLATALRTAWEDTQHYTAYVMAESEGPAAEEFNASVRRLVDYNTGSLTLTLQGCEHIERACRDQAQAIRDLKHQFDELAAEFALTFIIGQVLAAFLAAPTAGGSEAAGQAAEAAEAAGITARAMALLRQFIGAVVVRMKTVGSALGDLARVLPTAQREAAGLAKSTAAVARDAIPNAENATIDSNKIFQYALNPDHPVGGNKARVFKSTLGFTRENGDDLMAQLQEGVRTNKAIPGKVDQYGSRFTVDIPVTGPTGSGIVRTGWILRPGSTNPTLTKLFVK
jgi:hypothetical protein